jgi:hypothetical protein
MHKTMQFLLPSAHAKPATILRYAAKVKVRHTDTRKKAESAFTGV